MADDGKLWRGQCHCGAVRFQAKLKGGLDSVFRCSCSYCGMRGAVIAPVQKVELKILQGEDFLSRYSFNTHVAQHIFCSRCGIGTHLQRRSDPDLYGVNVACLEGLSPFDFDEVPVTDGVHHPSDTEGPARRAGVLRFIAAERVCGEPIGAQARLRAPSRRLLHP